MVGLIAKKLKNKKIFLTPNNTENYSIATFKYFI